MEPESHHRLVRRFSATALAVAASLRAAGKDPRAYCAVVIHPTDRDHANARAVAQPTEVLRDGSVLFVYERVRAVVWLQDAGYRAAATALSAHADDAARKGVAAWTSLAVLFDQSHCGCVWVPVPADAHEAVHAG